MTYWQHGSALDNKLRRVMSWGFKLTFDMFGPHGDEHELMLRF